MGRKTRRRKYNAVLSDWNIRDAEEWDAPRVMIYGRKQMQEGTGYVWDYVACLYPEGYISDDYNIFFQQEEIDKVHRTGMYGFEETRMQQILNSMD